MNPEIKKLSNHDIDRFKELILVFEDVFEMKDFKIPDNNYLQQSSEKDSFFVFAAIIKDKVVGGLTSYTLQQYYSKSPLVYIFELAIKTEFQRKGIGKMLMAAILNYCKEIGVVEVLVQADQEDEHAIEFYHSTGGIAQRVVHFDYQLSRHKPVQ